MPQYQYNNRPLASKGLARQDLTKTRRLGTLPVTPATGSRSQNSDMHPIHRSILFQWSINMHVQVFLRVDSETGDCNERSASL
jgi:hypothetical protein